MERHGGDKPKGMAVPQFGAWDQKGGASPNYSVVFGQARAKRKHAKNQIKLGNEANPVAKPEQNEYKHHNHNEVDFKAKIRVSTDHETLRPKYELKFDTEQVNFKANKNESKLHNEANYTRRPPCHAPNHGHQQQNYQHHHQGRHYGHYHQSVGVAPRWKSIPQFGSWDQKGGTSPNYSAAFSQARKFRRQAKQDAHYVKLNLAQDQTDLAHQTHHVRGYHYNHQRHRYHHYQDDVSKRRFMTYIKCCMRPQH